MKLNAIVYTDDIKQKALALGFDLVGVTSAEPLDAEQIRLYQNWVDSGLAAGLHYMTRKISERFNPRALLPGAKSVIVTAVNYKPLTVYNPRINSGVASGLVASYACYDDYHIFIKKLLLNLADFITSIAGPDIKFKICVDSAPFAERSFAVRAGLGFIGKNHFLINPLLGPQLLLGEIITTLELVPDKPLTADCGSCSKCIKVCPAGALRDDGRFDAGRCISYLTIEHKDDIPANLAAMMGNHIFGCDGCILCCPYQQNAPCCKNKEIIFFPERANLNINEILEMDEELFKKSFFDSPLLRTGLARLKRNARICLENLTSGRPNLK
jgi:epoxyqueuosine reductase